MADREKVLKALEHHKETAVCNGCPYAGDNDTPQGNCPVYDDAITLLKEQKPVTITRGEWEEYWGPEDMCPVCLTQWMAYNKHGDRIANYCPGCGSKIAEIAERR